jgi:catechol 2,3-dioxygenase-like lactoylglutathione lyase family enzyme
VKDRASTAVTIGTIEIPVGDLRRAVGWYASALGFDEEWSDDHHALMGSDGGDLKLLVAVGSDARLGFTCAATGLKHGVIDVRTDDLDALHARLAGLGSPVDPLDEPGNNWAPRGFGFEDSEGNRLAAFSYAPARQTEPTT